MTRQPLRVTRMSTRFIADHRRVITRPFLPGDPDRIRAVLDRVLGLPEDEAQTLLERIRRDFGARHKSVDDVFEEHFREVAAHLDDAAAISPERRALIGAYFTMEYSIEAAALFNPSIVPHPDQSNAPSDALRIVISLRATGEGHVSSIAFRTGTVHADGRFELDPVSRFVERARRVKDRTYEKKTVFLKLIEMGAYDEVVGAVLDHLPDEFVYTDLIRAIDELDQKPFDPALFEQTADNIRWLARSNYHLKFRERCDVSEVVIFPVTENESRGIEDARFVRFVDDDGTTTYYGTYTAYNGFRILPQLLETSNFTDFKITTLNGRFAQNKGIALFPRRVNGWYMMIGRVDGENLYLMTSRNIRFWNDGAQLQTPKFPWEFVQIGNCGSPIETERGWLLLTHGVGPMRRYCIGATLLDLNDPSRVIAQLKEPLLAPSEAERDGYVPNVVYSCGALIHNGILFMPYAMSDSATSVATISASELLDHMVRQ